VIEHDDIVTWIIGFSYNDAPDEDLKEFLRASHAVWPRVTALTERALAKRQYNPSEIASLTFEIWENALRSVWKTWQQRTSKAHQIQNLEHYLIGIFHHRLNRYLGRQRCRDAVLEFMSPVELEALDGLSNVDKECVNRIEQGIQLEEVYAAMDEGMRAAVVARVNGCSWAEIAEKFQIKEQSLMMRMQYAIRKVRREFSNRRFKSRSRRQQT